MYISGVQCTMYSSLSKNVCENSSDKNIITLTNFININRKKKIFPRKE